MEKVNLRDGTIAANFLATAITLSGKSLKGKVLSEVSLTVDGVEVPFVTTMAQMVAEYEKQVEHLAIDRAVTLVTDAGLSEVMQTLAKARQHVHRAVLAVRDKVPDDKPHVERV